ncbi:MAG: AbrB/MazE/SpoVT family DNA-binding domain-containing protein [Candidatus Humimicrobiaceae bacterium]
MINKIKVTSKGQITIPRALREEIKIREGMYLNGYIKDGNLVLRPLPQDSDKIKLINYAYKESRDSIGISKVREMTGDFNLNMSKQVREIREQEAVIDE